MKIKIEKTNEWGVMKRIAKAGMFITILFLAMQFGVIYRDHLVEHPGHSLYDFVTYSEEFTWRSYTSSSLDIPDVVQRKIGLINNFYVIIRIILVLYVFFEVFSYMENKNDHWVTWLINKTKGIKEKLPKLEG